MPLHLPLKLAVLLSASLTLIAATAVPAAAEQCFWRGGSAIVAESSGWFACNNTQVTAGGAQLCCLTGSYCGEDSICHFDGTDGGSGWFIGGCTDPSYADQVCSMSCSMLLSLLSLPSSSLP